MKKIIALLLALSMVFALCACGSKDDASEKASAEKPANVTEKVSAQISVEDFKIVKIENGELWYKVKVRNITESDLERITFDFQILDNNGDVLFYQSFGATNVAAGQAIWAGQYRVEDACLDEAVSVCFVSTVGGVTKTPLKEKVVFALEDYME